MYLVFGSQLYGSADAHTCIVDKHINSSLFSQNRRYGIGDGCRVGDVQLQHLEIRVIGNGFSAAAVDGVPLCGQLRGDDFSKAGRGTGDEDYLRMFHVT